MKKYSQFLKELPSKTVVFAFGRFNPPTSGHELLVKAVKKLAASHKADHAIYASKSQDAKKNPLTVDKKVHYLNLMFPKTNFVAANPNERTFIEAAASLSKRYKNLIMVAGSDRIPEYTKILNKYNGKDFHFDTIEVISAGERDPDADDASGMSASKMRTMASKGDYAKFKTGLPSTMRDIDGKRLMNDVRQGMGLEPIKEQLNLVKDTLREKYFRGEIFNVGDIVESSEAQYEIVKRGSNHLLLKSTDGSLVSKWIQDVTVIQENKEMNEDLTNKTLKTADKIKVARIIATMLGVDNVESSSNPEQLVNSALRKVRTKALNQEALNILEKMLNLATEVGIDYDGTLKPSKLKEDVVNKSTNYNIAKDRLRYKDFAKLTKMNQGKVNECECEVVPSPVTPTVEIPDAHSTETFEGEEHDSDEMSDDELEKMAGQVNDVDDILDVYEDEEFVIVDDETGEEIEDEETVNEEALDEVLSRTERIRAKMRFARTKAKRQRAEKIALHRYSDNKTINKRSRRLAVKLMKKRLLRGRNASTLSVGEKERIERIIQRRKQVIGRLAMKLAPRIRKIEKDRMSHSKVTQAAPSAAI